MWAAGMTEQRPDSIPSMEYLRDAVDRLRAAEQILHRVRDRASLASGVPAVQGTYQSGYAAAMSDILRALDGGAE